MTMAFVFLAMYGMSAMWSQWPWPIRMWSAFLMCWSIRASSTLMGVLGLNLPAKKPVSKRLNHGSKRIVLLPKVISQPLVPNHLKLTPADPGPPLLGGVSAPSASPGSSTDFPHSTAAAVRPAASPAPRNCRRDNLAEGSALDQDGSMKHMASSFLVL
jgi:hypothetical protein